MDSRTHNVLETKLGLAEIYVDLNRTNLNTFFNISPIHNIIFTKLLLHEDYVVSIFLYINKHTF